MNYGDADAELGASLSGGSVTRALATLEGEEESLRAHVARWFFESVGGTTPQDSWATRETLDDGLETIKTLVRDWIVASGNDGVALVSLDHAERLHAFGRWNVEKPSRFSASWTRHNASRGRTSPSVWSASSSECLSPCHPEPFDCAQDDMRSEFLHECLLSSAHGGAIMNLRLGTVALTLLATGCSGGAGTPPAASPAAFAAHVRRVAPQASQKLYISNIDGSVLVDSTRFPNALANDHRRRSRPGGLWVDRHGVLYAVNLPDGYYQTSLPEYKPIRPFRTITDGIVNCGAVAVDAHENVYVTGLDTVNGDSFSRSIPRARSARRKRYDTARDSRRPREHGVRFNRRAARW